MIDKKSYIKNNGLTCPFCGAEPVDGGFIQVETGFAFQKMSCTECDGHWQDIFQLVDVVFFETSAEAFKDLPLKVKEHRKEVKNMKHVWLR